MSTEFSSPTDLPNGATERTENNGSALRLVLQFDVGVLRTPSSRPPAGAASNSERSNVDPFSSLASFLRFEVRDLNSLPASAS
jgi:hypothetical protein